MNILPSETRTTWVVFSNEELDEPCLMRISNRFVFSTANRWAPLSHFYIASNKDQIVYLRLKGISIEPYIHGFRTDW